MTKAAFEKIVEGLREAVVVTAMANQTLNLMAAPGKVSGEKIVSGICNGPSVVSMRRNEQNKWPAQSRRSNQAIAKKLTR